LTYLSTSSLKKARDRSVYACTHKCMCTH